MLNRTFLSMTLGFVLCAPLVQAQTTWRAVAGEDGRVLAADLPAGTNRNITDIWLGDVGAGLVGFRVTSPDVFAGYWGYRNGSFKRYTQLGVTGNLGPGRTGSEASHVFMNVYSEAGSAGADGQRTFWGRAGLPGNTASASYGVWRWDGNRNIEIARSLTDGVYGPGLGDSWVFPNESSFALGRPMTGGNVLLDATVTGGAGESRRMIAKHVPGIGNRPCLRSGSIDPALSPGLTPGDSFSTPWSMSNLAVTPTGKAYGVFNASGSRFGIWEICNGAPRAIVVNNDDGALGPDIGIDTAVFSTGMEPPRPAGGNAFYFFSYFRPTPGASSEYGLFWHDGSRNRPMAMNDAAGFYGPNWNNSTWRTFNENSLSVGGEYAAFSSSINVGANPTGLWRIRAGHRPELVALLDLIGQYGPEDGRVWSSFGAIAILANGDIILEAITDPGDTKDLWLLEIGKQPRRILQTGQAIDIPTTTGTVQTALSSFDLPNGGADYSVGRDSWIGADGTIMIVANVSGYGEVILTSKPSDRIFAASFD